MAVDHTRALPVAPERLEHLAQLLHDQPFTELDVPAKEMVLMIALQAEQVEHTERATFFLQEAYDIYNARFG